MIAMNTISLQCFAEIFPFASYSKIFHDIHASYLLWSEETSSLSQLFVEPFNISAVHVTTHSPKDWPILL